MCRGRMARALSSMQTQQPGSLPDYQVDPYQLLEDDLKHIYDDIRLVSGSCLAVPVTFRWANYLVTRIRREVVAGLAILSCYLQRSFVRKLLNVFQSKCDYQ